MYLFRVNRLLVLLASRISAIIADILVLWVTWRRTYDTIKVSRRNINDQGSSTFAGILIRDAQFTVHIAALDVSQALYPRNNLFYVSKRAHSDAPSSFIYHFR